MKVQIEFEVTENTTADQIHELLCLAIHEGDTFALDELQGKVTDITDMNDRP